MRDLPYAGFYINLDASPDRRAEVESEIARCGLQQRYRRFSGIKGNALGFPKSRLSEAEIGVFSSHAQVLKANADSGMHLHVVEDDAVFSRFTEHALRFALETGIIDQYDILFTDTFVTPDNRQYQYCKRLYDRCVQRDETGNVKAARFEVVQHIAGMNSYIVNRQSAGKVADALMRHLGDGARVPIDIAVRALARKGALRTGSLFPFATGVRLARLLNSTVTGRSRHDTITGVAAWFGRHSFFLDGDMPALCAEAERLLKTPGNDLHHRLLAHILSFSLTEKYRPY